MERLPVLRAPDAGDDPRTAGRVADAIVELVSRVPTTREHPVADPEAAVRRLTRQAARRAAVISGGLALPPGPLGMLTVLPDLIAIWRIQAQLVADIAGVRGHSATLTREQMLYCLFRHAASHLLRDLVVRAGQRAIVHRVSVQTLQAVATRLGVQLSQQLIVKSVTRWVPGIGAAAVAAYAWYDTDRVARTADALFARDGVIEMPGPDRGEPHAGSSRPAAPAAGRTLLARLRPRRDDRDSGSGAGR
jgi:hypothetical protein